MNDIELIEFKNLYADGFPGDSKEYINFFFDEYIKKENIISYRENGKLISAGYIIEKKAHLFGQDIEFPYLTALSTISSERGKNKLLNVIKSAFDMMYKRGYPFVGLHPFNYTYYKKFGLSNISYAQDRIIKGGTVFKSRIANEKDYESMLNIYNLMTKNFDNFLITDKIKLLKIFREYESDGLNFEILTDGFNNDFAFFVKENNEIFYYATTNETLFSQAENIALFKYKSFLSKETPYLQGRVINLDEVIRRKLYPNKSNIFNQNSFNVKFVDKIISHNNCCYKFNFNGGNVESFFKTDNASSFLTIDALNNFIFNNDDEIDNKNNNFFIDKY